MSHEKTKITHQLGLINTRVLKNGITHKARASNDFGAAEIDDKGIKRLWRPVNMMGEVGTIDDLLSDLLYVIEQEQDSSGNKLEQMIKKGSMN